VGCARGDSGAPEPEKPNVAGDGRQMHPIPGGSMQIRKTAIFVATMFAAGTVFAFHCPQDMKKIDDAMAKNPTLSASQMAEVKKDRAEGEALHKAGKHQESVDTLAKAMKILDIK
jgi:hypothetical protein